MFQPVVLNGYGLSFAFHPPARRSYPFLELRRFGGCAAKTPRGNLFAYRFPGVTPDSLSLVGSPQAIPLPPHRGFCTPMLNEHFLSRTRGSHARLDSHAQQREATGPVMPVARADNSANNGSQSRPTREPAKPGEGGSVRCVGISCPWESRA